MRLRSEFPSWAFLYDPWASAWIGVRGKDRIKVAATALNLRDAIAAEQHAVPRTTAAQPIAVELPNSLARYIKP